MKSRLACLAVVAIAMFARQRPRPAAEERRDTENVSPRNAAQHVDPRGGDLFGQHLVDADLHEPRDLRPAQGAEQRRDHRAGARDQLAVERRRQGADLQAARGREMARRQAVHQRGREVHLRDARRHVAEQVPQESAQGLVRQPRGGGAGRRHAGHLQAEAAAAGAARDARLRLHADLCLPCHRGGAAHQPGRHRPVQVRRAEAERVDQARARTRTTGRRACPISTASNTPSSRTARPRSSASSPASST